MFDTIPLDFFMNLFLVALLLATIGYCAVLNRRLANMRDAHAELRKLTEEFDKALVRSKAGVDELKSLAATTGKQFRSCSREWKKRAVAVSPVFMMTILPGCSMKRMIWPRGIRLRRRKNSVRMRKRNFLKC